MDTRGVTGVLKRVVEAHEGMKPDAFNDDLLYKTNLNQARRAPPPPRTDPRDSVRALMRRESREFTPSPPLFSPDFMRALLALPPPPPPPPP